MQIDVRSHSPQGGPYSAEHIDQAAGILKGMLNHVKAMHASWPAVQQLRGLLSGDFMSRHENVLVFGPPGAGKTHALCAVAQELVRAGRQYERRRRRACRRGRPPGIVTDRPRD